MNGTRALRRYARALLETAEEQKALDEVGEDSRRILELIKASGEFREFLGNLLIEVRLKRQSFEVLFGGKVQGLTLKFLLLLAEKRRERFLEGILREFLRMMDERKGIVTAQVTSAVELTPAQKERLSQRLSAYAGKQVRLETEIEPELKGGFIARLGDTVFDGSAATQLRRLRQQLAQGQFRE